MKGTTQFRRKEQEMFLDKFRVVAVTTLKPSHFEHFSKHLLDDFSFIERYADRLCVREDGYADSLLVLSAEGDDGILVNSEGSHYARYSSFLPYAKPLLKKQIKEIKNKSCGMYYNGSYLATPGRALTTTLQVLHSLPQKI